MSGATVRLVLRTLRRNKGRSFVMALGFIVGVVSITLTEATGEAARTAVRQSFRAMIGDLDVLLVQPGGDAQRGRANLETSITTLTADDAAAIRQSVPNVADVGVAQVELGAVVEANGRNTTTPLFATSANYAVIRGDSMAQGAFFTDDDGRALARVAVIGSDVARELFPTGAVGQHLRMKAIDFTVVGVIAPNGAGPGGFSMDNIAYIPFETARRRVFNRDYLNIVNIKLANPSRWAQTAAAVHALVRQRHGTTGAALDDFRVTSPQAMIARMAGVDSTLRRMLVWIGGLALVIGGIVVAVLMLAAASARRIEIAVRRAVGATRADIRGQFWSEAALISAAAAVIGAAIANGVIAAGAFMMRAQLSMPWAATLGAVLVTIAIGTAAGYLPARRAASIAPADALRAAE